MGRKKKEVNIAKESVPIQEYKPNVYFDSGVVPVPVDKANVGDKVKFVVEGRVVSKSERDDVYTGGKRKSASVEIDKVKTVKSTKKETPKKAETRPKKTPNTKTNGKGKK